MSESSAVLLVVKGLDIGGVERVVVDLALEMHGRGVPLEVAVVNDRRDQMLANLTERGITVHRLDGSDRIGLRAAIRLARLVRQQRFSVVHVHGPLPAVLARMVPGHRAVVTTSHTPLSALRRVSRLLWSLTARLDAATLAVSAVVADSLPVSVAARVEVVPHGVNTGAIDRALLDAHAIEPSAATRVLVVASHREAKNYPNLLRALRCAIDLGAQLRVTAVGAGPLLAHHRAVASSLRLHDIITFTPPTLDVLRIMATNEVLVVASDYEGQPLVVLEALAMGMPVVATAVGRIPELLTPDVGRIVAPNDADALGAALAEVALDAALRQRMARAARRSRHGWSLEQATDAHLAVYARVGAR